MGNKIFIFLQMVKSLHHMSLLPSLAQAQDQNMVSYSFCVIDIILLGIAPMTNYIFFPVDVVKELLEKRKKILEQRRQQERFAAADDSDSEAHSDSDASFVPSNHQSASDSDNAEDMQETPTDHQAEEEEERGTDDENEQQLEEHETGQKKKRQKRRIRQAVSQKRLALQRARNSGQSYVSPSGKEIAEKVATPLTACRKKCSEKLSPDICSALCALNFGA